MLRQRALERFSVLPGRALPAPTFRHHFDGVSNICCHQQHGRSSGVQWGRELDTTRGGSHSQEKEKKKIKASNGKTIIGDGRSFQIAQGSHYLLLFCPVIGEVVIINT